MLINFCEKYPDVGYVQGMNIIAAAIVTHTKDTQKAKDIFDFLMV